MNTRVILSLDAKVDIRSAVEWYYRIRPNLAFRFEQEILKTLLRIGQFPYRFRVTNGAVRQAVLKRFPYAVYYSLRSNVVSVTAVLHQRRSDAVWINRGNGHS